MPKRDDEREGLPFSVGDEFRVLVPYRNWNGSQLLPGDRLFIEGPFQRSGDVRVRCPESLADCWVPRELLFPVAEIEPINTAALLEELSGRVEALEAAERFRLNAYDGMMIKSEPRPFARPQWNDYFLDIAVAVSARADCRRSAVGAVIVDSDRRIVSTGYNGVAPGAAGCLSGACPRGLLTYEQQPAEGSYSNCIGIHAEQNALNYALDLPGDSLARLESATLYCTRRPCQGCTDLLNEHGVRELIWR